MRKGRPIDGARETLAMDPPAQNGPGAGPASRIVLSSADGHSNTRVAADLRVCP